MLEMMRALLALNEQFPSMRWDVKVAGNPVLADDPMPDMEGRLVELTIRAPLTHEQAQFLHDARHLFA